MQKLEIKGSSLKYRNIIYSVLVFFTSFWVVIYFDNYLIRSFCFLLILVSIFFAIKEDNFSLEAIIIPDQEEVGCLAFVINGEESYFWNVRKSIVINGWIFLIVVQQGSNKSIKLWLHKSNFKQDEGIRILARYVLLSQNN
ncbi:MAG: hypothetical protein Kow0076_0970 [Francisella sp.]